METHRLLLYLLLFCPVLGTATLSSAGPGSPLCPCLGVREAEKLPRSPPEPLPPPGYGGLCTKHDLDFLPECIDPSLRATSPYCEAAWCYVDQRNCTLAFASNSTLYYRPYSYATCGYRDLWKAANARLTLQGQTLRVVVLGNTGGWKGSFCPGRAGQIGSQEECRGPMVDFFQRIQALAGFQTTYLSTFPAEVDQLAARMGLSSQFDVCTLATGLGYVDVCIGAFTQNSKRSDWSHFAPHIFHAPFALAASRETSWLITDAVLRAFQSFSGAAWIVIAAVVIGCSTLILFFEWPSRNSDSGSDFQDSRSWTRALFFSIWIGAHGFFSGTSEHQAKTLQGRLVSLGFGFFLMFMLAAYTASLVTILLKEADSEVTSITQAINQRFKICIQSAQATAFQNQYPGAEPLLVVTQTRDALLTDIDGGKCKASIVSPEDLEAAQAQGAHCDKMAVGAPLTHNPYSFPVAHQHSLAFGYWVSFLKNSGGWERALETAKPQDTCGKTKAAATISLSPRHFAGPAFVTILLVLGSLFIECWRRHSPCSTSRGRTGGFKDAPVVREGHGATVSPSPLVYNGVRPLSKSKDPKDQIEYVVTPELAAAMDTIATHWRASTE